MIEDLRTTPIREYQVHLENTIIKLLIDAPWETSYNTILTAPTPHIHVTSELFVCGKGEVVLQTNDGYLSLFDGDAAIVPPGVFHRKDRTAPKTQGVSLSFLCIHKNTNDCSNLYKTFLPFISGNRVLVYRQQPSLFTKVNEILKCAETSISFAPALLMASLLISIAEMPREAQCNTDTTLSKPMVRINDIQRMLKLDQIIETYYMQNWKIDDIAAQLHIGIRQLDRNIRKRYGKTLHELIMDKRIQTAEKLLISSSMTTEAIAVTVGFSSISGFYREFVRRHGNTPAVYRKMHKTNFDYEKLHKTT